jgi:hypothetical protein
VNRASASIYVDQRRVSRLNVSVAGPATSEKVLQAVAVRTVESSR